MTSLPRDAGPDAGTAGLYATPARRVNQLRAGPGGAAVQLFVPAGGELYTQGEPIFRDGVRGKVDHPEDGPAVRPGILQRHPRGSRPMRVFLRLSVAVLLSLLAMPTSGRGQS